MQTITVRDVLFTPLSLAYIGSGLYSFVAWDMEALFKYNVPCLYIGALLAFAEQFQVISSVFDMVLYKRKGGSNE